MWTWIGVFKSPRALLRKLRINVLKVGTTCSKQNVSQMLKKHTGPTIWFHSIKLKLFKIQLTGSSLALFWFCKTVISKKSKNKSLNLLIKINLKSFTWLNEIKLWDQCVFGTFVTFGRRSAYNLQMSQIVYTRYK